MADLLQTLSAPRRRSILAACWRSERSAGEIHRAVGEITFGAVSQHLAILHDAGLVTRRKDGRRRLYQARPEALGPLRAWFESLWDGQLGELARLAELEAGQQPSRRRTK